MATHSSRFCMEGAGEVGACEAWGGVFNANNNQYGDAHLGTVLGRIGLDGTLRCVESTCMFKCRSSAYAISHRSAGEGKCIYCWLTEAASVGPRLRRDTVGRPEQSTEKRGILSSFLA